MSGGPRRVLDVGAVAARTLLRPSLLPADVVRHARDQIDALSILTRAGILGPQSALQLPAIAATIGRWGLSPVSAFELSVVRRRDRPFVIDASGAVTFDEAEALTNSIARGIRDQGVGAEAALGVLCGNDRSFLLSSLVLWKLGVDSVYLNTSFAKPEIADVVKSQGLAAILTDSEHAASVPRKVPHWVFAGRGRRAVEHLAETTSREPLSPPGRSGRHIILTSGTTGKPRGAARSSTGSIEPALAILSRIPLRVGDRTLVAAPLFHAWGFAHLLLGLLLSSTFVLLGQFDPERCLAVVEQQRVSVLVAVPLMLQRILELPSRTRRRYDLGSLRVVGVSGSQLSADLAGRFMDEFGDVLYNLYGSTEVAWATIADPADLREAPGTVGRVPRGTVVRIYDGKDREVARGASGRIFVGNEMLIEGYTGGESRESIDGLQPTGDLGHFASDGRLFVDGRTDEMIVSGGENVYPAEVEEALRGLSGVADAAVVGAEDAEFGQSLVAYVVKRGSRLTEDAVRNALRTRLARYKVPKRVQFVDQLPRNAAGKVLKQQLHVARTDDRETDATRRPRVARRRGITRTARR